MKKIAKISLSLALLLCFAASHAFAAGSVPAPNAPGASGQNGLIVSDHARLSLLNGRTPGAAELAEIKECVKSAELSLAAPNETVEESFGLFEKADKGYVSVEMACSDEAGREDASLLLKKSNIHASGALYGIFYHCCRCNVVPGYCEVGIYAVYNCIGRECPDKIMLFREYDLRPMH